MNIKILFSVTFKQIDAKYIAMQNSVIGEEGADFFLTERETLGFSRW